MMRRPDRAILTELEALPQELMQHLSPLLGAVRDERDMFKRIDVVSEIRRLWRGI